MLITKILLTLLVLMTIVLPIGYYFLFGRNRKHSGKRVLAVNILTFASALVISMVVVFSQSVRAAGESGASSTGLGYIAAALAVGLACIGSGIAVANSASAALGALSEDSTVFGKSLVFVGLSEGIALYGLIIAFMILGAL